LPFFRSAAAKNIFFTTLMAAAGQFFLSREGHPWTLPVGLFFFLPAVILFARACPVKDFPDALPGRGPSVRMEGILFFLVMTVAVFFRVYRLSSIPRNLFVECANIGLGGLHVLYQGWRPFYESEFFQNPGLVFYLSAAWFKFFQPTQLNLGLFYAAYSLAAFPFVYWTFRQLAGPWAALLTLFIFSVMRCDVFYSRWGHSMAQPPFYLYTTLALGLYGLKTGRKWVLVPAAVFCSLGLYTYQSFKVVPVFLAVLLAYEAWNNRSQMAKLGPFLLVAVLLFGALTLPITRHWVQLGTLGARENGLFIGNVIRQEKSPRILFDNMAQMALMFNRRGKEDPLTNIPHLRWLDDVTGVLWVLGLGCALWNWRKRWAFYSLSALSILSLVNLLTVDSLNVGRVLQMMPFLAFLASVSLLQFWEAVRMESSGYFRKAWLAFCALSLAVMAWQNYEIYFIQQANDPRCLLRNDLVAGQIAREVAEKGDLEDYYLCPRYSGHHTIQFLNYFHPDRFQALRLPEDYTGLRVHPGKRGAHVILDEGKGGVLTLFQSLYPKGETRTIKSGDGVTRAYDFWIPSDFLTPNRMIPPLERGLKGSYWVGVGDSGKPVLVRLEPVVNFTFREDFPMESPYFSARLAGDFEVRLPGDYDFALLTYPGDSSEIRMDGKPMGDSGNHSQGSVHLGPGRHHLELFFVEKGGFFSALSLLWRKPGTEHYEVMPNEVFGKVSLGSRMGRDSKL
jgi:hypothetical protein